MQRLSSATALQFFLRWVILTIALFIAYLILPGIRIEGSAILGLVIVALLMGGLNALFGPLLTPLSAGTLARTSSVFVFILNAFILWLSADVVARLFRVRLTIDSFVWAFLGAIIVTVVSELLTTVLRPDRIARALLSPDASSTLPDARTLAKRLPAMAAMLLSFLLCFANLAGIVALWVARQPAIDNTLALLDRVAPVLVTADNGLVRLNAEVGRARGLVDRVETSATQLGDNIVNNRVVLTVISNTVGSQLVQSVANVAQTVSLMAEVVRSANDTATAINALPFASVPVLPDDARVLVERAANLQAEVRAFQDRVRNFKAQVVGGALSEVTDRTARVDALLAEIESAATRYLQQVRQARQAVELARSQSPTWINLGVIGASALLLWVALSQVVVFFYAWSWSGLKPLFIGAPVRFSPD